MQAHIPTGLRPPGGPAVAVVVRPAPDGAAVDPNTSNCTSKSATAQPVLQPSDGAGAASQTPQNPPSGFPLVSQAKVRLLLQTSQNDNDQFYTKWTSYPGKPGCWYAYYQYYSPTYKSWRYNVCIWYSYNSDYCYNYSPYSNEYWGCWYYPTRQWCKAIDPQQGVSPLTQQFSQPGSPPNIPNGGKTPPPHGSSPQLACGVGITGTGRNRPRAVCGRGPGHSPKFLSPISCAIRS